MLVSDSVCDCRMLVQEAQLLEWRRVDGHERSLHHVHLSGSNHKIRKEVYVGLVFDGTIFCVAMSIKVPLKESSHAGRKQVLGSIENAALSCVAGWSCDQIEGAMSPRVQTSRQRQGPVLSSVSR